MLPERSHRLVASAYAYTALHNSSHATGCPTRLNRPTLVDHRGFGSESCRNNRRERSIS